MGENSSQHRSQVEVEEPEALPSPLDSEVDENEASSTGWRRFLWPILLGLAVFGGIGWLVYSRFIMPFLMFSGMKAQPTPVQLTNPRTATVSDTSDYAASLDSREAVTLQPQVSGRVVAILVQAGETVTAGQPLLQIDAAEQQAQVASRAAAVETARAEVSTAQAEVASAQQTLRSLEARRESARSDVLLNRREYERFQALFEEGATSRQVLDQRLNAVQTAEATQSQVEAEMQAQQAGITRAQAQVERNQRALEQAQAVVTEGQAQLSNYRITAPFSGVVGDIPAKVGDMVSSTTSLISLTQSQQLEVKIAVPLERADELRLGLPVQLLNTDNRVLQSGQISYVDPNVDPTTQSVQARATFGNPANLRPDQFVRARMTWSTRPGVLVPTSAISRLGGRNFIFAAAPFGESGCEEPAASGFGGPVEVEPDQLVAVQKPIQLGKIVGDDQEVLEGISERDRIIPTGILQLQNCTPIVDQNEV
ncbi:efflux RND transporter periplasmic adaptor subunit [Synechococcales cyanobacterium C]|uniref:Efflux RND transporter periplasmic adaptor subunit n=1 Tax=Petrachloros mirabilis ULC683 TaxID=2781853 RepID=A0A8K2A156_9CYAN|nr:efflux RND transporter periplasmic adaptor subunit [Petrachloros mirabilis]NCJ07718.1 efflux RND transporter periplasmic adaptor subunit [Petrachloros mirabilis ULC683]